MKDGYVMLTHCHKALVLLQDHWKSSKCLRSARKKKIISKLGNSFLHFCCWMTQHFCGDLEFQNTVPTLSIIYLYSYLFLLRYDSCLWQFRSYCSCGTFKYWEKRGPPASFEELRVKDPKIIRASLNRWHKMEYVIDSFMKFFPLPFQMLWMLNCSINTDEWDMTIPRCYRTLANVEIS